MDIPIARADGVYLFDDNDNRYFDVSGGPMAVNLRTTIPE